MSKFGKLKSKTKVYLIIAITSCLFTLVFGFKDSGNVQYRGYSYSAGSVFSHEEYSISGLGAGYDEDMFGEIGKSIWGDSKDLNGQLKQLRQGNFILMLVFGLSAAISGYLLWKDEEVFDLFTK